MTTKVKHRYPNTLGQLNVLKLLATLPEGEWTVLDRHAGKSAGTLTRVGTGLRPLVESHFELATKRSRYRITNEGRKALARVETEDAERAKRVAS